MSQIITWDLPTVKVELFFIIPRLTCRRLPGKAEENREHFAIIAQP
jgi:hypothetical protein